MIRIKEEKGLTLIEVVVSIVLLSIIITAVFGAFISFFRSEASSEERLAAVNLTESIIEILESYSGQLQEGEYDYYFTAFNSDINGSLNSLFDHYRLFEQGTIQITESGSQDELFNIYIELKGSKQNYDLYAGISRHEIKAKHDNKGSNGETEGGSGNNDNEVTLHFYNYVGNMIELKVNNASVENLSLNINILDIDQHLEIKNKPGEVSKNFANNLFEVDYLFDSHPQHPQKAEIEFVLNCEYCGDGAEVILAITVDGNSDITAVEVIG